MERLQVGQEDEGFNSALHDLTKCEDILIENILVYATRINRSWIETIAILLGRAFKTAGPTTVKRWGPLSVEKVEDIVPGLQKKPEKSGRKFNENGFITKQFSDLSIDDRFLVKAKAVVENHISDSGFGVAKFAEEMHVSRTQLFRRVKAITGLSPSDFVNTMRLERASQLILAKADTVTQICYLVGFNEPSYFAKRFRKQFGVVPSKYQTS
jgi:AraC-like DNA-binding protein